jgi:N utilization substance protein A
VYLDPDQVSLAIGKGGSNIKLASKLTGFEIDVFRNTPNEIDDVDLDEFSDELEGWVIDALKNIGCDTARSVLDLEMEELIRRTDLEEETVKEVVAILASEFED